VSLGTQRTLCSGAQEQRSGRAETATRLYGLVAWIYLGSLALLKERLAPGQAMLDLGQRNHVV